MSEQTKADIVERLKRYDGLTGDDDVVLVSIKVLRSAVAEIARLRAERPGWREGIEAAATICEEEARESYDNGGFNAFNRAAKRIRALHPSVAEGRGEKNTSVDAAGRKP